MSQLTELHQPEVVPTTQRAPSPTDVEMLDQQGVDVWGILSRRKWLVIMGFVLGIGLGYIYLLQASPVYESTAQVLIEDKKPPTIPLTGVDNQLMTASAEDRRQQRIELDLLRKLSSLEKSANAEMEARIQSFELAYRMQTTMPKLLDVSKESEATKKLYGIGDSAKKIGYR